MQKNPGANMNYASAVQAVLKLDETVYPAIMAEKRTGRYCVINVLVFGILHALFSLHFSEALLAAGQSSGPVPIITQILFIIIGAAVAFLMHAGGALFLWVFSRGIGGNTAFLPVYFNLGISFAGLWPLAPILAALQSGVKGPALYGVFVLASAYALAVVFFGTKSASGLSAARMGAAMATAIVFVTSFMYLWI